MQEASPFSNQRISHIREVVSDTMYSIDPLLGRWQYNIDGIQIKSVFKAIIINQ